MMQESTYKMQDELASIENELHLAGVEGIVLNYMRIENKRDVSLLGSEQLHVAKMVAKRRNEFETGRNCARLLMARMGYTPCEIPVGSNREPIWPIGFIGSISHDGDYCVVVGSDKVNVKYLGIDIADDEPLDDKLLPYICSSNEIAAIKSHWNTNNLLDPFKLVFSIKESVYKCLFPYVGEYFDFKDVEVIFCSGSRFAKVELINKRIFRETGILLRVYYKRIQGYIVTLAWVRG